jgi:hypothetical protein
MKRNDPKWKQRFDGMCSWNETTLKQWERAKTRRQEARKRVQKKRSASG